MLNWNITQTSRNTHHAILVSDNEEDTLRKTIEASTDKAISLLKNNIQDDSLYLLFEWKAELAQLTIFVTDATKNHDAPESVCCAFPAIALSLRNQEQINTLTETVKFWLHDYLTTCTAFFSYSLVAIFHSSNRENTELL